MNAEFMIAKLVEHKLLSSKSKSEACSRVVCDVESKVCMYNECETCKNKHIVCPDGINLNAQVWIHSWENTLENRIVQRPNSKSENINVRVVVKKKIQLTLNQLVEKFSDFCKKNFCKHIFNITHQFHQLKNLKENITQNACVIHVDFSENYACKYSEEVQSVHFGASRNQVSMHTGVIYQFNKDPTCFCTMSENTRHDPSAIWAHLDPILKEIQQCGINVVHFISDGPTTQYRSRNHFYLLKDKMHRQYGFLHVTWNFSESGHGKGAPDGVGGLIKHKADKMVAHGADIKDARDLINAVKEMGLNVKVYLVPGSEISAIDSEIPSKVKLVSGTMSVHQVISCITDSFISTRVLSCFCKGIDECLCFSPKKVVLHEKHRSVDEVCIESAGSIEEVNARCNVSVDEISSRSCGAINEGTSRCSGLVDVVSSRSGGSNDTVSIRTSDEGIGKNKSSFKINPLSAELLDENLIGEWCVVLYEGKPFPGIIQDVDTDSTVEVKVLNNIGNNRWFWPLLDDVFWYKVPDAIVTLIPELLPVTKRHMQILPEAWAIILELLDLDIDNLKYR
jgi:hypothetical protein